MNIRKPYVAGQFYPSEPGRLSDEIERLTNQNVSKKKAKGIVSPHAGYVYSGQVAGMVFSSVEISQSVIILGPNHTGQGPEVSIMDEGSWEMPMGSVEIDQILARAIVQNSDIIHPDISAQIMEHSIEVQVPFLQYFQPRLKIVPIVLGRCSFSICQSVAQAIVKGLENTNKDTLIVASTDLTHYKPQTEANENDRMVIDKIINLDARGLLEMVVREGISMCGVMPVTTMILAAKELGARNAGLVKYMTSGDVSGDYSHVVGYAGMIIN